MTKILIGTLTIFCLTSLNRPKPTDCDIEEFYKGVSPAIGTKILNSSDELEDVELLLIPIDINKGKYVVNVTRKGENLYKVDNKNIYIETKYCYEYSYSEEVVLEVSDSYGYTKGKIIF